MIYISIMQTATVADLRNNFRRVSAWIDDAKPAEITRHGRPFARLVPALEPVKTESGLGRISRRSAGRSGGTRCSAREEVAEMEAFEMEGQEDEFPRRETGSRTAWRHLRTRPFCAPSTVDKTGRSRCFGHTA